MHGAVQKDLALVSVDSPFTRTTPPTKGRTGEAMGNLHDFADFCSTLNPPQFCPPSPVLLRRTSDGGRVNPQPSTTSTIAPPSLSSYKGPIEPRWFSVRGSPPMPS